MDPFTHTLIGLVAGEAVIQARARRASAGATGRRALLWSVSAVANVFPDVDFTCVGATAPAQLGYVLHHRGYTHTLVAAPVQGALVVALAWLWLRLRARAKPVSRADWGWAFGLAVLGPMLHVGLDGLNTYGVHPYWPFDAAWRFGDTLFIVEPALLLALGAALYLATKLRPAKARLALAIGAAASAAVVATFALASACARTRLAALHARLAPDARLLDVVLTPYPLNPLCWSVVFVGVERERYFARRATYSAWARALPAAACPEPLRVVGGPGSIFRLTTAGLPSQPELRWHDGFEGTAAELRRLRAEHCSVDALLRFVRVPAWTTLSDGTVRVGDLRFDGAGKDGRGVLGTLELPPDKREACPSHVPSWRWPRLDLLDGA
ncbi:MAG: metal-dependent hydrolase [Deltaproteobacteria bacterium]|nr:metal-dependent hydrolase [Deltaproteobacteria bacterium]